MEQAARQFFRLLVAIFDVCVVVPLLWYFIGWQALTGIIFLFLLVPFGGYLTYLSGKLRLQTAVISDRRINLMTEIIAGIREVKTHAWEWFFRDHVKEARRLVERIKSNGKSSNSVSLQIQLRGMKFQLAGYVTLSKFKQRRLVHVSIELS